MMEIGTENDEIIGREIARSGAFNLVRGTLAELRYFVRSALSPALETTGLREKKKMEVTDGSLAEDISKESLPFILNRNIWTAAQKLDLGVIYGTLVPVRDVVNLHTHLYTVERKDPETVVLGLTDPEPKVNRLLLVQAELREGQPGAFSYSTFDTRKIAPELITQKGLWASQASGHHISQGGIPSSLAPFIMQRAVCIPSSRSLIAEEPLRDLKNVRTFHRNDLKSRFELLVNALKDGFFKPIEYLLSSDFPLKDRDEKSVKPFRPNFAPWAI